MTCGFIHGDIKPSNIMLQKHPDRQIVAKLLDFSGTTDASRYGTLNHRRFVTKLWAAPEVLGYAPQSEKNQSADVYSMGLVLAQMWPNHEFKDVELESFLEHHIPKYFTPSEKEDVVIYFKCYPESDASSAMSQAICWTQKHSHDPRSKGESIFLHDILKSCLSPSSTQRKSTTELLEYFRDFAVVNKRELPTATDKLDHVREEQKLWRKISDINVFVTHPSFVEAPFVRQQVVLRYMEDCVPSPNLENSPLTIGKDSDYEDEESLRQILTTNGELQASQSRDEFYIKCILYQIARCYLLGWGTVIDEAKAILYLASAAMGAVRSAMFAFSGVEASCEQPLSHALLMTPRRLFLALGYAFGIVECGDMLHAKYPTTFRLTQILIAHSWAKDTIEEECPFPVPPGFLDKDPLGTMLRFREVILEEGLECPFKLKDLLFASIRAGRVDLVQKCLDNGASPNEPLKEDDRATPLHASCLIPDAEGAEIAKNLLSAGAEMSIRADEEVEVYSNPFYCGRYTPIHWAISKNRLQVFSALLDWCSESSVEPMDGGLLLVDHMVYHRRLVLLRRYMDFLRDHGREHSMSPRKMCHLLRASVEETDNTSFSQRWMHAENFRSCRRGMILYLLELGADPLVLEGDLNPIRFSIKEGDDTCLRPMLNSVEAQGHDVKHLLSRDGLCRNGLTKTICRSALLTSTLSSCMDVFYYLSDHHPELINQKSVLRITPLFQVASEGKMGAVKALLEKGADPNLTLPNEPHSTPLTMALVNGYYDVARAIVCDSVHSELLFPLPNWSVFGAVLGTFCSGILHIELQAFSFIHEHGGLTYMIRGQDNVFREVLHRGRPFLEEDVGRELEFCVFF
jgi:ankyrin repeat protein